MLSFPCHSLTELDKFIKEAEVGVAQDLGNGDYDTLVSIMGHLVGVRERIHSTDAMFEPLKSTIALVKQYGDDLPETMHLKLQVKLSIEGDFFCMFLLTKVNMGESKVTVFEKKK